jgi:hypothetical protein
MKYLKRYSEAVAVYQNHEHKSVIEDLLLDLRDSEFHTTCSIQNYHRQYEKVRVHVSKEKEFSWNDISYVISDIVNYMKLEDYEIFDFTCKDDIESKVNPDDYEIKKMKQGNLWRRDPNDFSIKPETKDYWVTPHITQTSVYDPGTFNKITKWAFDITFKKRLNEVDKTNEELNPNTYFRAADKLKQWGHKRRPDVLTAWGKEVQDREKNARKKRIFEEDKKLGQFQLKFESRGQIKFANCYLSLLFNNNYYEECLTEWLIGDRTSLWIGFLQGFHPVSEEDSQVLEWFLGSPASNYASSETGVIWLQDFYINIANTVAFDFGEKLPMKSSGIISIENGGDFNEVYFANRREAIKFRNLLVDLFEGDIEYKQSNGKDFKEEILEALCHHEERPVELSEFEELIDKLRVTRLNYLYRD